MCTFPIRLSLHLQQRVFKCKCDSHRCAAATCPAQHKLCGVSLHLPLPPTAHPPKAYWRYPPIPALLTSASSTASPSPTGILVLSAHPGTRHKRHARVDARPLYAIIPIRSVHNYPYQVCTPIRSVRYYPYQVCAQLPPSGLYAIILSGLFFSLSHVSSQL